MSNLVKQWNTTVSSETTRVLDMNDLVAKRIQALAAKMGKPENSGFVSGIPAESVEVDRLLGEDGEPMGEMPEGAEFPESGNVIKAQPAPDMQAMLEEANEAAEQLLAQAREQAEALIADAHARIDAERKDALDRGYQEGYSEATRKAEEEARAARAALEQEKIDLEDLYQRKLDEIESKLVETITEVYEHVFRTDLKLQKPVVVHLVAQALQRIEGARSFLIHVSRENYEYVLARKSALEESVMIPGSVVEIVEDISLPENSCLIETDGGIFDCSMGTELTELSAKLRMLSYTKKNDNT